MGYCVETDSIIREMRERTSVARIALSYLIIWVLGAQFNLKFLISLGGMGTSVRMSRICCRDDGHKKNKTGTYCCKSIFFSRLKIISWGNKQGGLLRKKRRSMKGFREDLLYSFMLIRDTVSVFLVSNSR